MKKVNQHIILTLSIVVLLVLSLNTNDLFWQYVFFAHEEVAETVDIEEERLSIEKSSYKSKVKSSYKSRVKYGGVGIIPDFLSFNPTSPYVYLNAYSLWNLTHGSKIPKYILHCCLKVDC